MRTIIQLLIFAILMLLGGAAFAQTPVYTKTPFATTPSPIANRLAYTNNGMWFDSTLKATKYAGDSVLIMFNTDGVAFKIPKNHFLTAAALGEYATIQYVDDAIAGIPVVDTTSLSNRIDEKLDISDSTGTGYATQYDLTQIPTSTADTSYNPNFYTKIRGGTPVIPLPVWNSLAIAYQPDVLALGTDTVIAMNKDENIYALTYSVSINKGNNFLIGDTAISTMPNDTAYNYTRLQRSVSILNRAQDSIITCFTSGSSNNLCCFAIGYSIRPRNNPLATIPKTSIRRLITAAQIATDFSISNVDYCAIGEILKINDTFYVFADVGHAQGAASGTFCYIVLYKTVDFVTMIPIQIVMYPQKPALTVSFPSVYKGTDNKWYAAVTEDITGGFGLGTACIRHRVSDDLLTWKTLPGKFLETNVTTGQTKRVYAGAYLKLGDGTNTTLYGTDTNKYYMSGSNSVTPVSSDRIFLVSVFPNTVDAYMQENRAGQMVRRVDVTGGIINWGTLGTSMLLLSQTTQAVEIPTTLNMGTQTVATSAALNVVSTTRGVVFPRMTTVQMNAIASPTEGLLVYDLTDHVYKFWNGTAWTNF